MKNDLGFICSLGVCVLGMLISIFSTILSAKHLHYTVTELTVQVESCKKYCDEEDYFLLFGILDPSMIPTGYILSSNCKYRIYFLDEGKKYSVIRKNEYKQGEKLAVKKVLKFWDHRLYSAEFH